MRITTPRGKTFVFSLFLFCLWWASPPSLIAQAPTSTCDDPIEVSTTNCGTTTNPNTPSGGWGPLPADGLQTLGFGFPGGASIEIDFNCVTDDIDPIGDLEIRLHSSAFVSGPNPCFQYLENVYDVRDSDGNEALELITILVEFTGCSSDTESPVVTCTEFAKVFNDCPIGLGPNTPSGDWFDIPPSGIIATAAGGSYITNVDLNSCVTDNISPIGDMEWELVSSYEENRTPGCSIDLINEIRIRDACGNESANTFLVRSTIRDIEPPEVTCAEFSATYAGCPGPLGANTPTGSWFPIGPTGGFTAASGGIYTIPVDLTSCVSDNCVDLEDLEYSLASSYEENRTSTAVTLVNEFSIRDLCGRVAIDRVITKITVENEAPVVTCTEFTSTQTGCPGPLGPNTPNGTWNPVGPSGSFLAASGGSYTVLVDLNSCVSDDFTALENLEYSLFDSYEENRTSSAVTLVNEFSIRDECGDIAANRVITKITIENEAPVVTCAEFTSTQTGCPAPLGPNTPNGTWFPIGPSGIFTAASGGSYLINVDLSSCVSDDATALADLEISLLDSYEENRTDCQVTLVNEFSVRDECGDLAADRIVTKITVQDDEAPAVTCAEFTSTQTGCPAPLGPNTPDGTWFPVGPDGMFTSASGGSYTIDVDLTSCVSDNCSDLENLEFSLHSSYEENSTNCQTTLVNEFSFRDECGNVAPERVITKITVLDDEAPTVDCIEFSATFSACPDPLGPNTVNGGWFPLPSSGSLDISAGGRYFQTIDLSSCVADNCSTLGEMEWTIVSSYEENRIPGCSVDIINEIGIRDACANEALTTILVRSTIQFDGPPPVVMAPADVILECTDDTSPASTGTATATSGCGTPNVTFSDLVSTGCGLTQVITRSWTATDGCGQQTTLTQTITVQDNTPPVIATAPGSLDQVIDITTQDACPDGVLGWTCFFQSSPINPISVDVVLDGTFLGNFPGPDPAEVMDNCELSDIICQLRPPTSNGCITTREVIWIGVDACGNQSLPFVQTFTINELAAPVVACTEFSETFNRCPDPLGPNTPDGNWQPVPPNGLLLTAVGGSSIGTIDLNCVSDFCSTVGELEVRLTRSYEENRVPGCSVDILNEYEVRDACGNVSPDLILFRGQIRFDGPPPVLTTPIAFPLECGMSPDPAITGMATATSGCGTPVVTFSDQSAPGSCGLSEIITRTWLATDGCGKTSEATQLIFITDNTAPVIATVPDVTVNCDDDTTPAGTGMPTATDACTAGDPALIFADDVRPGNCPGNYVIRRTWTATDDCANSTSYLQIITVQDIEGPVFAQAPGDLDVAFTNSALDLQFSTGTCLTDLDVSTLETSINAALTAGSTGVSSIVFPTPTDACSDPITTTAIVVVNPATVECLALIDVTYTSADACGNTSEYMQQIQVTDNTRPTVSVSVPDLTVECDMPTDVAATGTPVFVDDCPGAFISITHVDVEVADPTCPNGKTITRTFTATDPCGNTQDFVQVITVVDTQAPFYTSFPRDTTIECSSISGMRNEAATILPFVDAQGFPVVEDNCSTGLLAPYSDNFMLSTDCPTVGIYERTFAAIDDGCGNILPARTLTITVIDTMAPIFTFVPRDGDVDCAVGVPPLGLATAVDCDPDVVITEVDEVEVVGENQVVSIVTRTITATDACGNESTRELVFRILDTQDPQIVFCPTDIGPLVADPNDMLVVDFPTPQFTDNCGFSVSGNIASGTQLPVGLTMVTYTAIDEGGNVNSCSFTIEIIKALNIACTTADISIDNPADFSIADINFPYATTTCDECPQGNLSNLDYLGYFRGHRYYVSKPGQALTWLEANDYAISLGGRLVQIDNAEENLFIQRELPYAEASIGLYAEDGPGDWVWTFDDNNVGFDNWAPGAPDNDPLKPFGIIRSSDGMHLDVDQSQRPYIIEFNCIDFEVLGGSPTDTYGDGLHAIEYVAVDQCGNRDTCAYTFRVTTFDVRYCVPGDVQYTQPGTPEYSISSVSIGAFAKTFSANDSYYHLRDTVTLNEDLATGISLSASSSGSDGDDFPAYWRVWVDANRDGDFYESGELIFEGFGDADLQSTLELASSLGTLSPTRIRVGMNRYSWPEPCGDTPYGDYKDFSLNTGARQLPIIALRGQVVNNTPMLSVDSHEDPSISGYMLLRGETQDELSKYITFAARYNDGGQHTYTHSDNDPLLAAYYQAVALDEQGFVTRTSNVVQLTLSGRRGPIATYPNPARDLLEVDLPGAPEDRDGELELYDALGRRVVRQVWPAGSNHQQVALPYLPSGTYMLRIAHPNRQPLTKRISIEQSSASIHTGS